MSDQETQRAVDRKNLRARSTKSGQSAAIKNAPVYIRQDEKIDVEIRDIIRVKPQDFAALKNSFEDWASQWD